MDKIRLEKHLQILRTIITKKRNAAADRYWKNYKPGEATPEAQEAAKLYAIYTEIENEYWEEVERL